MIIDRYRMRPTMRFDTRSSFSRTQLERNWNAFGTSSERAPLIVELAKSSNKFLRMIDWDL